MHYGSAMFFEKQGKTRSIPVFDPKHQLSVVVKSRGGSHSRVNPLCHERFRRTLERPALFPLERPFHELTQRLGWGSPEIQHRVHLLDDGDIDAIAACK